MPFANFTLTEALLALLVAYSPFIFLFAILVKALLVAISGTQDDENETEMPTSTPETSVSPEASDMEKEEQYVVYILSKDNGMFYVDVTSHLLQRIREHRNDASVCLLMYYEPHVSMEEANRRKKQIVKLNRSWIIRLIEERNPQWRDLGDEIIGTNAPG